MIITRRQLLASSSLAGIGLVLPSKKRDLEDKARSALQRAVRFYREEVGVHGGYLWRYSDDLSKREGEGEASAMTAWVQPPGTPTVGLAYLRAFEAVGDNGYLEAARETAYALVRGQLRSGGWTYRIEFEPTERKRYAYRKEGGREKSRNVTTLDDDTSQAALRFLMRADSALGFKDDRIHEASEYALASLLKAQYPNGAWPQGFDQIPEPTQFPAKKASYPESWSREYVKSDYWRYYTINDGNLERMVVTLLEASEVYRNPEYRRAALRIGDFLVLAQIPEPQPAWAQQYDFKMHPAWARKFEPPSITGGESQGALRTLLALYAESGDRKLLAPIPPALDYLRRSRLPDGRLARFYELKTNRPLYFTRDYRLTYEDTDLPTHYGFKVADGTLAIERDYRRLSALDFDTLTATKESKAVPRRPAESEVVEVIRNLDARGRWIEDGRLRYHGPADPTRRIIDSATFAKNIGILSAFLKP